MTQPAHFHVAPDWDMDEPITPPAPPAPTFPAIGQPPTLHRGDQAWLETNPDKLNEALCIVGKNRMGPCDVVRLTFLGHLMKFVNHSMGV